MKIVDLMPDKRLASATPWAWFPAEAATTSVYFPVSAIWRMQL
jgi:hypothetical protein